VAGQSGTPYAQHTLENRYIEGAHAQGGLTGFPHPYLRAPATPGSAASTLIALDAALGLGDYYDIGALYSDELGSAGFYYRLLNAGFRIAATGGTDNFSDVWRDPPPGSARTYARVDGPLSVSSWLDAVRAGRTFMSTGPLLTFTVEGRQPGDVLVLGESAAAPLVRVEARSITPLDSLQIVVNGDVVRTVRARRRGNSAAERRRPDEPALSRRGSASAAERRRPEAARPDEPAPARRGSASAVERRRPEAARLDEPAPVRDRGRVSFEGRVPVPRGGWIAARALGPASPYVGDDYAFAHTGPVYVERGEQRYVKAADVAFLAATVDSIWARAGRSPWRSEAEREEFRAAVEKARSVYRGLAGEAAR
jgi:hypothetical protein